MNGHRLTSIGVLLLAGWLASGGAAPTRADEQRKNFVSCPIVRDTASVPCWLTEYEGETYFLTLQTDVSAPVTPPWLGHQVLVEGVVSSEPRICGGVVLKPVHLSVLPERDASCSTDSAGRGSIQPHVRATAASGAEQGTSRLRQQDACCSAACRQCIDQGVRHSVRLRPPGGLQPRRSVVANSELCARGERAGDRDRRPPRRRAALERSDHGGRADHRKAACRASVHAAARRESEGTVLQGERGWTSPPRRAAWTTISRAAWSSPCGPVGGSCGILKAPPHRGSDKI